MGTMDMAKLKKTADIGKTRLELRFDTDVYDGINKIADEAGVSVNQLMQGLARWAIAHANQGEASFDHEHKFYRKTPQTGCIWFGEPSKEVYDHKTGDIINTEPEFYFQLDFTERRVVRDDVRASYKYEVKE